MSSKSGNSLFDARAKSHTIVIARGDRVRHWTLPSWGLGVLAGGATLSVAAGVAAIGLLLSSDRVIQLMLDREVRTTNVYEDRINGLRQELDRVTTRQLVDREEIGRQVGNLLSQQQRIVGQFERLGPLMEQAADHGLIDTSKPDPTDTGVLSTSGAADPLLGLRSQIEDVSRTDLTDIAHLRSELLPSIRKTVGLVEEQQRASVSNLSQQVADKVDRMTDALKPLGKVAASTEGMGGPFVAASIDDTFDTQVRQLEQRLAILESLKNSADQLPLGDPQPKGTVISSGFGVRSDPFLERAALHTGIDFAGLQGTSVRATGAGRVVSAGDMGGYGQAVEIDHGNGVSTRFAHLSRIDAHVGDHVKAGTIVGAIGSTGRSTGPHLHYEVRIRDEPVDPQRYIRAGRRWAAL
ncbi:M23 family metallopeptidase [Aureimonas sp. ME7]|uniref:M23 family metallopeptidase n=1 Tax=Aureimonas sp. ME7 TaxID=2744252 RepID=UPI0015F6ECAE|nr:M23 family metallopeptidase [Aureimonas sp. ME7]